MPSSETRVRCVAFDAVGTLIHAEPAVAVAYATIGQRYGADLSTTVVRERFRIAFARRQLTVQTSEADERAYWQSIVEEVLGPVHDFTACFTELYDHFARPESWRVAAGAATVIRELKHAGLQLAVASNFDHRLHTVLDGLPELAGIDVRLISAEIGWRKPSRQFYETLCTRMGLTPAEILMVGDDYENDVRGAQLAGIPALYLSPGHETRIAAGESQTVDTQITELLQVLQYI